MRAIIILLGIAALALLPGRDASADNLMFGVWSRPACGKVCKLVCEEKTITAIGYACHCDTICIPGPSCQGCKHCEVKCCCDTKAAQKGCAPKIEFCWYDWFSNGCAAPRQVKVLTKWQAERKIAWYHWEVVDGCTCMEGGANVGGIYCEAPVDAQIGQAMPLSVMDQVQLTSWMQADAANRQAELANPFEVSPVQAGQQQVVNAQPAQEATTRAAATEEKPSMLTRFTGMFKSSK
jgi:hypothetical protein